MRLAALAAGLVVMVLAAPAHAATHLVTFDDQPDGTFVTNQYKASEGVYFDETSSLVPHVDSEPLQAHSNPNVADIASCDVPGGCGESFPQPRTRGFSPTLRARSACSSATTAAAARTPRRCS